MWGLLSTSQTPSNINTCTVHNLGKLFKEGALQKLFIKKLWPLWYAISKKLRTLRARGAHLFDDIQILWRVMIVKGFNTRKHGSINDPSLNCSISDNSQNDFIINCSRKIIITNFSNMAQQIFNFFLSTRIQIVDNKLILKKIIHINDWMCEI